MKRRERLENDETRRLVRDAVERALEGHDREDVLHRHRLALWKALYERGVIPALWEALAECSSYAEKQGTSEWAPVSVPRWIAAATLCESSDLWNEVMGPESKPKHRPRKTKWSEYRQLHHDLQRWDLAQRFLDEGHPTAATRDGRESAFELASDASADALGRPVTAETLKKSYYRMAHLFGK